MSCPAVIDVLVPSGPAVADVVTPGTRGPIGSSWIVGSAVPSSDVGTVGDFYLRANGDVYGPKSSSGWGSVQFTLTGSGGAALSDDAPQTLGTPAAGTSIKGSRSDHRHAMPTAAQVGADALGAAAAAVAAHLAAADPHPTYTTAAEAAAAAPVQSVSLSAPTGWSASTSNISGSVTLSLGLPTGYSLPSDANQANWNTAYSERLRWDGGAEGLNAATGRVSLGLAAVASSGAYGDLSGRPTLGTAAAAATTDFATAAQGTLAATAVQPAALTTKADLVGGVVPSAQLPGFVDDVLEFASIAAFPATGETGKLYISLATNRTYRWSGSVYVEINPSPGSTDAVPEGSVNLYFTTARGEATAASWWAASAAKTKLDGIASGATANATDAQLLARGNHTGTQAASTITGLATVATSGAYGDLSGRPILGTFAAADATTPPAIGGTTPAAGAFTTLLLPSQASTPATPANGFRLFANSSNALSWVGANGYLRTFDGTANTGNRTYTLPDTSGTIALSGDAINAANISSGTLSAARLPNIGDGLILVISNKGETATAATNYTEIPVPVPSGSFTLAAVRFGSHIDNTGSSSSTFNAYRRTAAGVKTSVLTGNATLASAASLVDASATITGGTFSAGDRIGVDLVGVGTGASGLFAQFVFTRSAT